jgi:hypothetical protein
MNTFIAQTRKAGDYIVVTLPKDVLVTQQIGANTFVKVTVEKIQKQDTKRQDDCSLGPDDPWRLLE